MTAEKFIILALICCAIYGFIRWCMSATPTPDPWGPEVERELQEPEARQLCHRCLTPQPDRGWFCEHCGASVGPYNNYMPYLYVFSQGEVLRAGTRDHLRRSVFVIVGYVLLSLAMYALLAPVYLFFVIRNLMRQDERADNETVEA